MVKRGNMQHPSSIPFDLVIEILLRLPSKSIARFRCASKLWGSTIRSPNFTELFFSISSSRPKLLFVCQKGDKTFLITSTQPPQNSSPLAAKLHVRFPSNLTASICRPIRGLVCGLNRSQASVPVICNPSTRQFLSLPEVEKSRDIVKMCLGYDPVNKQFKVLCMTLPHNNQNFSLKYQILTLETSKKMSWRVIECDIPCLAFRNSRDSHTVYEGICINGVCYFLEWMFDDQVYFVARVIVCFDVRSEKFKLIREAHGMSIPLETMLPTTLVNYRGELATVQLNIVDGIYTGIQLCVLKDAEKHEWLKYTYDLPMFIDGKTKLCCVGMTTTGEIVFSPYSIPDCFYLIYYHLERKTTTKVDIQGMEAYRFCTAYTFLDHVEDVKLMNST